MGYALCSHLTYLKLTGTPLGLILEAYRQGMLILEAYLLALCSYLKPLDAFALILGVSMVCSYLKLTPIS